MPTYDLAPSEHEILLEDSDVSLRFGPMSGTYVTTEYPSLDSSGDTTTDVNRLREDGVAFGEDFAGAQTVTFSLAVLTDKADGDPHTANGEALDEIESVWRDRRFRSRSAAYAVLRSHTVPGRTRRAYGRPRRFSDAQSRGSHRGISTVLCDFTVGDATWYDDAEQSASVRVPVYTGSLGFTSPLKTPITTLKPVDAWSGVSVGGKKETWLVVRFDGPCTNPVATIGDDIKVAFTGSIAAGDSVTYDPRPWKRSVLRASDGASLAGKLTYDSTPLRMASVRPGDYDLGYSATDPTGTSVVTVSWRNAWTRW